MESRAALLTPVFSKPLRNQPVYVQIGHIEALTYCLGLRYNIIYLCFFYKKSHN